MRFRTPAPLLLGLGLRALAARRGVYATDSLVALAQGGAGRASRPAGARVGAMMETSGRARFDLGASG